MKTYLSTPQRIFVCLFVCLIDMKFYDFLLSVFEEKVWSKIIYKKKKSFTCAFMDNIAFTVNMWEIYMANILKIVHIKKSTNSLTLTVLLFYETIQELRILDPLWHKYHIYSWITTHFYVSGNTLSSQNIFNLFIPFLHLCRKVNNNPPSKAERSLHALNIYRTLLSELVFAGFCRAGRDAHRGLVRLHHLEQQLNLYVLCSLPSYFFFPWLNWSHFSRPAGGAHPMSVDPTETHLTFSDEKF